ncbi:hypothetical protein ACMFMG_010688 [Clarireedia jacksonii]
MRMDIMYVWTYVRLYTHTLLSGVCGNDVEIHLTIHLSIYQPHPARHTQHRKGGENKYSNRGTKGISAYINQNCLFDSTQHKHSISKSRFAPPGDDPWGFTSREGKRRKRLLEEV